jgi:hypothetical protein
MALKGAREPVTGVKGAKGPRLRLPKVPRQPQTETSVALGEEYLRKRNQILDLKFKREAMNLAFERDQLIERELVLRQLTYIVLSMRQKLLAIPVKLYSRLGQNVSRGRLPKSAKGSFMKSWTSWPSSRNVPIQTGWRSWRKKKCRVSESG